MDIDQSTQALRSAVEALGGSGLDLNEGIVWFKLTDLDAYAYVNSGRSRLRGSVIILRGTRATGRNKVEAWVARQPASRAGVLEVVSEGDGGWVMRVLFERSLAASSAVDDPLNADCTELAKAWGDGVGLSSMPSRDAEFSVPGDPRDLPIRSAWVLLGDSASLPTNHDLEEGARFAEAGVYEERWTSAKQTVAGDLGFVYFTSPHKHVAYVTRAASNAFFDTESEVNAARNVRNEQWWAYWTPLVPIDPIPYARLQEYADGHLPLRGRSGRYLRPDSVERLLRHVSENTEDNPELQRVLSSVVGLADVADPSTMNQDQWRNLAPGALALESHVETHVVEPLGRFVLPPGFRLERQYKIGRRVADYVVVDEAGHVRSVIEVKLRVRRDSNVPWENTPDFRQVQDYAGALGCPAMLIDCTDIHLISNGAAMPTATYLRTSVGPSEMHSIAAHLTG